MGVCVYDEAAELAGLDPAGKPEMKRRVRETLRQKLVVLVADEMHEVRMDARRPSGGRADWAPDGPGIE